MNQKHRVDIKLLSPFYCPHPVVLRDIYGPFLGKKDVKIGILSILITHKLPSSLLTTYINSFNVNKEKCAAVIIDILVLEYSI